MNTNQLNVIFPKTTGQFYSNVQRDDYIMS